MGSPASGSSASVGAALEVLRRRLVDTGLRNRLIHVNLQAKRANVINVSGERSEDVYDLLRNRERRMRFRAAEDENPAESKPGEDFEYTHLPPDEPVDSARFRDRFLETQLGPQALERRLLKLSRDARTAEEEQGANFLFLALGFLCWYEDEISQVPRQAPLVLLPVRLTRLEKGFSFNLAARPDDLATNLPLQERLKHDFGLTLPEIDEGLEWSPDTYFDDVADVVSEKPRWRVDRDAIQLGFFSYAKALMFRDLKEENWPGGALTAGALTAGLLDPDYKIDSGPLRFGPDDRLDDELEPAELIHVVDADASQTRVIEEVRSGHNMVVQGPPGTGKSQTITNMIAAAVHDGKTVLFVAEKMAALNVVHERLKKCGLADVCLELHSRTANKRAFYTELQRTLNSRRPRSSSLDDAGQLTAARDRLNEIVDELHNQIEGRDYSPIEVIAELCDCAGRDLPPPRIEHEGLDRLNDRNRNQLAELVREFARGLQRSGPPGAHPFAGARAIGLQPTAVQRLRGELSGASDSVAALLQATSSLAGELELAADPTLAWVATLARCLELIARHPQDAHHWASVIAGRQDLRRLAQALNKQESWQTVRTEAEAYFLDTAWDADIGQVRDQLASGAGSLLRRWFGAYSGASRQLGSLLRSDLPNLAAERLALAETLLAEQRARRDLAGDRALLESLMRDLDFNASEDVGRLISVTSWVLELKAALECLNRPLDPGWLDRALALSDRAANLRQSLLDQAATARAGLGAVNGRLDFEEASVLGKSGPLRADLDRLKRMSDQVGRYTEWDDLRQQRDALEGAGLGKFADRLESELPDPDAARGEFDYAVAEARWEFARSARESLERYADWNFDRHRLARHYRQLDGDRASLVQEMIRSRHLAQLPGGAAGEMAFLRGEMSKKTRHRPVRQAFLRAPSMLQRIKPVLLMSPVSIAQFLPPTQIEFDLLLFDEASQVRPEDALGAIARARQIVVVGDDKQLPPTSFFQRLMDDTDEDEHPESDAPPQTAGAEEMESVLSLAEARGLPGSMLRWHYRSRDPSLIKVSNVEFYESELVLPPSPLEHDDRFGLRLTQIPGVYSSRSRGGGRPGTNQIEAERLVDAVVEHSRSGRDRDFSLGIVAFSKAQSEKITEILELRRRTDPVLDRLLREDKYEDVFVKNIENVQGDERDVIFISVGYGPHEAGGRLASMNFGPVNNQGGERRLNVLFTRARVRCRVFVSFDWREIDLRRAPGQGPSALRKFLHYADTRNLTAGPTLTAAGPDSRFEEDVARVIQDFGYPVDHQVGSLGFRIDLGVRDPDLDYRYILAVECDGATYHSALWARERDRLRQQVLEDQGWLFHRIWSTDWFYRREAEIKRLNAGLKAARSAGEVGFQPPAANSVDTDRIPDKNAGDAPPDPVASPEPVPALRFPPYRQAQVRYSGHTELHETDAGELARLAVEIVEAEGPVHREVVARRAAEAFGLSRTGRRIRAAVDEGIAQAVRERRFLQSGDFYMTSTQRADPPIRDRSRVGHPVNKPECLPPPEIWAAADMVVRENGATEGDALVGEIARCFGFKRTGRGLRNSISAALRMRPRSKPPN